MTIKVRTWGGLGDVLLMTPALRALKRTRPDARLKVYCTYQAHFDILQHNPYIDELKLSASKLVGFCGAHAHTAYHVLRMWGPLPWYWRRFLQLTRAEVAVYSQTMPTVMRLHATEIIGQMLNVEVEDRRLDVFLTEAEQREAERTMREFTRPVVIQVTSRCSQNKNWPVAHWETLVRRNPQYTFVQVGVAEEPAIDGAMDLRGRTSIRQAMALLKYATAFVGVESFMAHATNAFGVPGVVLFGPTARDVWSHPNCTVVARQVRCAPCSDTLRGVPCPYGLPCMTTLPVEEVEHALAARAGTST